ncbi:MAG: GNAT family N-acetyltransferase [Phycisphaerales bacterium]|nr:MAG: GNAT family N-acetyltransferase [Phycisphaerales bacterium]
MITTRTTPCFDFRQTDQLAGDEVEQFTGLFNRVFGKALDRAEFERKYRQTPLGHSYHGLMTVEGRIVGAYNLVPYEYRCFGAKRLFGLSVDAMIDAEHRSGPFHLLKMARLAYRPAARDGVVFAFGFPNEQAYTFTCKLLTWKELGQLEFYALPINIGALRPSLRWANPLSRLCAAGMVRVPRLFAPKRSDFPVEKVCDDTFRQHRYDARYGVIPLNGGGECTYRVYEEDDGVRVLYIIDVNPLTAHCFAKAVARLHGIAASCADLILYVGWLPFAPKGLWRVPPSLRPRQIRMCGRVLDPKGVDERILQLENWNVNISNFDVR